MKTPCGLLAPLEETSFKLEAEDRERLAELRREKVEKARKGELDHEGREGLLGRETRKAVSRIRQVDPNEGDGIGDDWAPGEFEAFCKRMQAELGEEKRATIQAMRWTPKGGTVNGTAGDGVLRLNGRASLTEPTDVEQRVLDYCHRVAPEGCRSVTSEEIGNELGYSAVGAWKITDRLRKKNLWLDGWTSSRGRPSKAVAQVERGATVEPGPPPKKPPAEKPAKVEAPAPVSTVDAPPPDSPAARSIAAHSTKYRITADERRARERDAETMGRLSREIRAEHDVTPEPGWKTRAIELHAVVLRVLEALPDGRDEALMVLEAVNFDIDIEARRKAVSA